MDIDLFSDDLSNLGIKKKDKVDNKDVILVLRADGEDPTYFFGCVQNITPNVKKGWWDFSFRALGIPSIDITWILREPQFSGVEEFTMKNVRHKIIPVDMTQITELTESENKPKGVLRLVTEEKDGGEKKEN